MPQGWLRRPLWGSKLKLVDATEYGWTYRVYASFDAFDDEVVAVYGWVPAPMTLTVQAPLFQSPQRPTAEGINPLFLRRFRFRLTTVGSRWAQEGCRWNVGIESGRHGGVV